MKNLGTMICNSAFSRVHYGHDCTSQHCSGTGESSKKYISEKSSLPKGDDIQVYVAKVLRQAETSSHVVKGGWIGGDAWFGSV